MKHLLIFLLTALLLTGCGQQTVKTDSNAATPEAATVSSLSCADSLDGVNSQRLLEAGKALNKAFIFLSDGDSTLYLRADMQRDHRIFGYAAPDTNAAKLLLFSVYTSDVENNPFGLPLGAFYDADGMGDRKLQYQSHEGDFVQLKLVGDQKTPHTLYITKSWIIIK